MTRDDRRLFRSDLKLAHILLGKLPGVRAIGPDKKDLLSRFEIEDPAAGSYVLLVREGNATGEIPFTFG